MSKISVSVTDGTNVNLTVSPRPTQTITVSRGSYGSVTSVTGTGEVSGITLSGSGNQDVTLTLGGALDLSSPPTIGNVTANDIYAQNLIVYDNFEAQNNVDVFAVSGNASVNLYDSANHYINLTTNNLPTNYTLTLPTDIGTSGQALITDGVNQTSWADRVGSITSTDGSITVTGTTTRNLSVASSPNIIVEVRNNTGATLTKGTAVYIDGAIGQLPTVTKAQANSDAASAQTLGLMTTDLANNANGYVTIIGLITNINTSAYTDGQQLYLSPTVAGGLTATKPSAPQHLVYVAVVEHAHITQGKLFVKVQNGYELDELHDVQIISPANGQTITYDSATSLWKNTTPAASGVTSVTATSPVQSTGGTTPVISLPAATTSTSGYLTSTDWNTFNNKQTALVSGTNIKTVNSTSLLGSGDISVGVTSVNGTGSVSGISLSGTVTSTGNITLGGSLDLSAPPAIGGTTPNTITGTVITAKDGGASAFVIDDSNNTGVTCTFNIDQTGTYNPVISATDGTTNYPLQLDTGLYIRNGSSILISNASNTGVVDIKAPTSFTTYYLTLPTTTGSNNQVLKTDGTGVLSWTTVDPLTLTGISDPTAPTGTNTTVYSKSFGGYPTLAARNALNTSFGLQSALWSKNIQMWTTTAATAGSWLNASGTGNGTYTNVNPTTGGTLYQTVRRSTYANVITIANQTLGIINGQASFFRGNAAGQGGYFFYARCGFDVWTNGGRFFAGLSQGATVVTANATGTNNTAGFAVEDTDAGAISFVTRAGSTATKTAVGLTITSNKGYDCYIYCSPNDTKITWQIIDINTGTSVTGTANTNLPTNTFMVNPLVLASNAALTPATSISLGIAKIYVESDY